MSSFSVSDLDMSAIVNELRNGSNGYVVVPGVFAKEEVEAARDRVLYLVEKESGEQHKYVSTSCMIDSLKHRFPPCMVSVVILVLEQQISVFLSFFSTSSPF
jgi:hypothetical protein